MAFNEYFLGKRERMSWIPETSFGSGGTMSSGEIVGLNAEVDPGFTQTWQEIFSAGADNRYVQGRVAGPLQLPFKLTFTPVNWKFLKYCGYSVVDAGANPYTHTFSISNSIQSFKFEWAIRHTTPLVVTLTGCFVKKATIQFQKAVGEGRDGFIKVVLECVAQNYSVGTSVTSLSNITATPIQWRHTKWTLAGSEVVEINSGTMVIDQSIDENESRYCNATLDRTVGEPIPQVHRINGVFNVNMKDNTYTALWDAAAVVGSTNKLEFIRGANDNIVATLSNIRLGEAYPSTNLEGITSKDIPWTAESFTSLIATDSTATY